MQDEREPLGGRQPPTGVLHLTGVGAADPGPLTGAVTTHTVDHDPVVQSWAAPGHLVIMGVLTLANWPADWRDLLRPSQPRSLARSSSRARTRVLR